MSATPWAFLSRIKNIYLHTTYLHMIYRYINHIYLRRDSTAFLGPYALHSWISGRWVQVRWDAGKCQATTYARRGCEAQRLGMSQKARIRWNPAVFFRKLIISIGLFFGSWQSLATSFLKCQASASARCPSAGLFAGSWFQVPPVGLRGLSGNESWCSERAWLLTSASSIFDTCILVMLQQYRDI